MIVTLVEFRRKQNGHILLASIVIGIFSFGERTLPDYDTHDIGLFNSMARPMKLRCCVQQGFPSKLLA